MSVDLKIYAGDIEQAALHQVYRSVKSPAFDGAKVRVMPDVHAGKGSVIGFTAHVTNGRVIPNVVGVDIGCGMLVVELEQDDIDLVRLDRFVRRKIPSGGKVHANAVPASMVDSFEEYKCYEHLKNVEWLARSLGTLGGGNHFIEVDRGDDGRLYLIIHSGSRNLGLQVAEYYQQLAIRRSGSKSRGVLQENVVAELKTQGRTQEIQQELKKLTVPDKRDDDLAYLEGEDAQDYLHDMSLCVQFARLNREKMAERILREMGLTKCEPEWQHVVHNYIELLDDGSFVIRKGAVSAKDGELVLVPLNMQHGCIICRGKGNPDWNQSAPHGAGRRCSRNEAFKALSMDEFKARMEGIYSTSVCPETLDESPMAYKDPVYITKFIDQTIADAAIIRPIYNFKAKETRRRWK